MGGVGVSLKGLGKGKGGESPPPFKNIRILLYKIIYTTYPLPSSPLVKILGFANRKRLFSDGGQHGQAAKKRIPNPRSFPLVNGLLHTFKTKYWKETIRERCL